MELVARVAALGLVVAVWLALLRGKVPEYGALMAVAGILAALVARQRTGRGQLVDVSMLDGSFAWTVYQALLCALEGTPPRRGTAQLTGRFACYNVYETRDGRWVTVGAYEPHFWAALCRRFGREDFIPTQWDEARRVEQLEFFRARFRERTLAEWMAELGDAEICFGPVNPLAEAFADPQLRHRGMVAEIETPVGPMRAPGVPVKLSDTPGAIRTRAAAYGEHTEAVLRELGYSASDVARLRRDGVV